MLIGGWGYTFCVNTLSKFQLDRSKHFRVICINVVEKLMNFDLLVALEFWALGSENWGKWSLAQGE